MPHPIAPAPVGSSGGRPVSYRERRRPFHAGAEFPLHSQPTSGDRSHGLSRRPPEPFSVAPTDPIEGWSLLEVAGRTAAWYQPGADGGAARADMCPGWVLLHLPDLASATRPGRSAASEEDRQRRAHRIGSGLDFVGPRDRLLVEAVGLPALVPDGGECWWLDRIVPSFHPTLSPAAFLAGPCRAEIERLGAATGGIATALAGIGMGGQGALGIAYRQPDRFPVVAAVDPRLDFHLVMRDDEPGAETLREAFLEVEHARQQTPILHVHPLHWPRHQFIAADPGQPSLREGVERLRGKLAALGIPHERLSAAGAAATMAAAAFLRERIERESNRLPGGPI